MKRKLIVAALILSTGIFASCKKVSIVQNASIGTFQNLMNDKKDLASGD